MRKINRLVVALLLFVTIIAGCAAPNKAPVIAKLEAPASAKPESTVTLSCQATDPEGTTLTYSWSAEAGTISGSGSQVQWKAPSVEGQVQLTVQVSDGKTPVTKSVEINVTESAPQVTLTASSAVAKIGQVITLNAAATDGDNDTLTYRWEATGGVLGQTEGAGPNTWSGETAGEYTITLYVSDGTNEVAQSCLIKVVPDITAEITGLESVQYGALVLYQATASASGGAMPELSYRWEVSGGTLEEPKTSSSVWWEVPVKAGAYTITVYITYEAELPAITVSKTVNVVDTPPQVQIAFPNGQNVEKEQTLVLDITVTDPEALSVTVDMTAQAGTVTKISSTQMTAKYSWTAPAEPGNYTLTLTVSDANNTVTESIPVTVVAGDDQALEIQGSETLAVGSLENAFTLVLKDATLTAVAYRWEITGGTFSETDTNLSTVHWNAPLTPDVYTIRAYALMEGEVIERYVTESVVTYDSEPVVTFNFPIEGVKVTTNQLYWMEVLVEDQESASVEIDLAVSNGTLSKDSSTAKSAAYIWRAPNQTGICTFSATVQDDNNITTQTYEVMVTNDAPVISTFIVPQEIKINNSFTIRAYATDAESDPLTYKWTASAGTIEQDLGSQAVWIAPATTGTVTLTMEVSDGIQTVSQSAEVIVVENHLPVISSISAPTSTRVGKKTNFVSASISDVDPDDVLSIRWEISGGTITSGDGTGSIVWYAPGTIGSYTLTVYASDDGGQTEISDSVTIEVIRPDAEIGLTNGLETVYTGDTYYFGIFVEDNDYVKVNFEVEASCGSLIPDDIRNKSAIYYWTAPDEAGVAVFTVTLSTEGYTYTEVLQINVVKNDPPVLETLTLNGSPVTENIITLEPGTVCNFALEASDPEGTAVTVNWSMSTYYSQGYTSLSGNQVTWTAPSTKEAVSVSIALQDAEGRRSNIGLIIEVEDGSLVDIADAATIQEIEAIMDVIFPLFASENLLQMQTYFHPDSADQLSTVLSSVFPSISYSTVEWFERDVITFDGVDKYSVLAYITMAGDDINGATLAPLVLKRDLADTLKIYDFLGIVGN